MKTIIKGVSLLFAILISFNIAYAQEKDITERYIIIDNIDTFFEFGHDEVSNMVSFELFNIYENESSKPVFVGVNELKNIIKFTIKSSSENFENQRTCFLKIRENCYIDTFRQVLIKMNVKYIKSENKFIEIDKFFSEIK